MSEVWLLSSVPSDRVTANSCGRHEEQVGWMWEYVFCNPRRLDGELGHSHGVSSNIAIELVDQSMDDLAIVFDR